MQYLYLNTNLKLCLSSFRKIKKEEVVVLSA